MSEVSQVNQQKYIENKDKVKFEDLSTERNSLRFRGTRSSIEPNWSFSSRRPRKVKPINSNSKQAKQEKGKRKNNNLTRLQENYCKKEV